MPNLCKESLEIGTEPAFQNALTSHYLGPIIGT